jgi:hypothetical protein
MALIKVGYCCILAENFLFWYIKIPFLVESNPNTVKHVLIMDEVDGMSGNQDRGGVSLF